MNEYFRFQTPDGDKLIFGLDWGINSFPDGQQQFWIEGRYKHRLGTLTCSLHFPEHVHMLEQILHTVYPHNLRINYLYGARCDKSKAGTRLVCNVADMLQTLLRRLAITQVKVVVPHCAGFLRGQCVYPLEKCLFDDERYAVWLYPDESAKTRFDHLKPESIVGIVCDKHRDQISGGIIEHWVPVDLVKTSACDQRRVLVIDDLCDGGRTFLNVAQQLPDRALDLAVTHGVFSRDALPKLLEKYQEIFTTNSLPGIVATDRVHVLDLWG